jgi:putative cell wall-binding protein/streptogramin lyase
MTATARRTRLPRSLAALAVGLGLTLLSAPLIPGLPAAPASAADFVPGAQTRFPLPDADAEPTAIVTGADGALWIAESNAHAIIRMTIDGTTKRYPIPSGAGPTDLAASPDGTIWWASSTGDKYGVISPQFVVTEWSLAAGSRPSAVTVGNGGIAWFATSGSSLNLNRAVVATGVTNSYTVGHGINMISSVETVGDSIWISDSAANSIVTYSQSDFPSYERTVAVPAPTAMTAGDGGVYVVSARSGIVKFDLSGGPTGNEWHDPGTPLITDLVVPAAGEQWFTKLRDKQVTVRSQVPGIPPIVDLPDAGAPSDLTVGPDGAIWYTALDTSEVVRIARDYEAPGIEAALNFRAPDLPAYVGEPLGPVALSDRGSGTVASAVTGPMPGGLTFGSGKITGVPTEVGQTTLAVVLTNRYYGGREVTRTYARDVYVRAAPSVTRIGGADRYEMSANSSRASFPSGAKTVYVASGEKFPDALGAGSVAALTKSPLLLTQGATLPASVITELQRLKPTSVVVVGGALSVSDAVIARIREAIGTGGQVTRVGGADRYEVSRNLLESAALPASPRIYLAAGSSFPDALSATPIASFSSSPVMLVDGSAGQLSAPTLGFLSAHGKSDIRIAGGPASVSTGIEAQLKAVAGTTVKRISGADRYATSVAINRDVLARTDRVSRVATDPVPMLRNSNLVYLASGETFPDALAGGVGASLAPAPLYVVPRTCVPRPVLLDVGSLTATTVTVVGGPNTLTAAVEALTVCP